MVHHTAVLEAVVPFVSEARAPQGSSVPHLDFKNCAVTPRPVVVLCQSLILGEICDVEVVYSIVVLEPPQYLL